MDRTNQTHINQTLEPYPYEEDTIPLMDHLLVIAKNLKWVILTPTVTCFITIIYVLFFADPVYVSTAKILPDMGSGSSSQLSGLAAQFGISIPGGEEASVTSSLIYPEIIKSRTLAKALLNRKFDTEKYGPQKPLLQILTYRINKTEVGLDTRIAIATTSAQEMIEVTEDRQSTVYTLEVSAFEPQFAADLATAVIEELVYYQREYKTARVGETRQFIEGRIEEVQGELSQAEEALKEFRERNRGIQNSPALLLEQERLSREVQVQTEVFITLKQQHEMIKIEEVQESALVQVLDPPEAPIYISKPRRKLAVILAGFLGIGMGLGIAFMKEYFEKGDDEEEGKRAQLKKLAIENIKELLPILKKSK